MLTKATPRSIATAARQGAHCPLVEKPSGKSGVRWPRPEVLVEVSYPNKSGDGRLRHPSFKGFRDDLASTGRRPFKRG